MAVFAGPKTVSDGLVFQIDQDNTVRSWKGKPTTNHADGVPVSSSPNLTYETATVEKPNGKPGEVYLISANTGGDGNRTFRLNSFTVSPGTYTMSYYIKNINCSGFRGNFYSPTLGNLGTFLYNDQVNGGEWSRVSQTVTIPTGTDPVTMQPQLYRDGGYGQFYLTDIQFEESSFATPFVAGTRSNTQAVIDIVGSNTVTSGVTYTSDGLFEFDGSDDYLSTTNWNTSLNIHSVEMWTYHTTSGGIYSYYLSDAHRIRISDNGTNISLYSGYSENGPLSFNSGTNSKTSNTWHHVVCTLDFDNNSYKIYIDGKLKSTATTALTAPNLNGEINIGCHKDFDFASPYYYSFYDGKISQTRLYSKVLTADEVMTNFEASRDRYGV